MAFIVLVAVGADYNMLLISEIRDESALHGIRSGIIRTVGSTGGVITSAGVIFAASMFGLLFANLFGLVEAGLIIGAGLLLDTFVVRTITVPALAVLVGQANWWPILWGRPRRQSLSIERPEPAPAPEVKEIKPEPVGATDRSVPAVWVNELGGVTFQLDGADVRECIMRSPTDLAHEVRRLRRAALYAAVPREPDGNGDRARLHANGQTGVSVAHPYCSPSPNVAEPSCPSD